VSSAVRSVLVRSSAKQLAVSNLAAKYSLQWGTVKPVKNGFVVSATFPFGPIVFWELVLLHRNETHKLTGKLL
jgi:hypothetical protein